MSQMSRNPIAKDVSVPALSVKDMIKTSNGSIKASAASPTANVMANDSLDQAEACQDLNLATLIELVPPARRVPLQVEFRIAAQGRTPLVSSSTSASVSSETSLRSIT